MTFDVEEYHGEFSLFKDHESSHFSLSYHGCDVIVFCKPIKLIDMSPNDPQHFDYECFEGQVLDGVKMDLVKHLPLSIVVKD